MSNTNTTVRPLHGRAAAELLLQAIDDKALSVADAAQSAGLPVAEVSSVLHDHPSRLTADMARRLADALGVTLTEATFPEDTRPAPVCPSWCEDTARHGIEAEQPLNSWYYHQRTVAKAERYLVQVAFCQDFNPAGGPVPVGIHIDASDEAMTPAEARALAAAIIEAATVAEATEVRTSQTPDGPTTYVADAEAIRIEWPAGWTVEQRQQASDDLTAKLNAMVAEARAQQ